MNIVVTVLRSCFLHVYCSCCTNWKCFICNFFLLLWKYNACLHYMQYTVVDHHVKVTEWQSLFSNTVCKVIHLMVSVCSGMLDELWAKQWRCPWSPWEMLKGSSGSVIYYYYYICYYLFYCTSCIFSKKDERKLLKSEFKLILFVYRITHSPQKALTTG